MNCGLLKVYLNNNIGEIIYTTKLRGTVNTINTQNWAQGSYYYQVIEDNVKMVHGKLIIIH